MPGKVGYQIFDETYTESEEAHQGMAQGSSIAISG